MKFYFLNRKAKKAALQLSSPKHKKNCWWLYIRKMKKCILDRTHFLPSNDKVSKWMICHTNWLWNNSLENFLWNTNITQIWLFCVKFDMEFTGQQINFSVELVISFSKGTCFNFAARIVEFFGCKTYLPLWLYLLLII